MPNFKTGAEGIAKATERTGGEGFRPFTPKIFWQNDGDERWLVFLTPLATVPTVALIDFIKQQGKKGDGSTFDYYEEVIARTEKGLDNPESSDPMVDTWKATPKQRSVAVAVELDVEFEETRGGHKRPISFKVKTKEFDRKVRDAKGDATDEIETIEAPVFGFVVQSPHNFFNVATSFDAKTAPFDGTPIMVAQVGKGSDVAYTFSGFESVPLDLSDLFETIDGISYLTQKERDALYDEIEDASDDDALVMVGRALLNKRMDELADADRYQELFDSITEEFRQFGKKDKKGSKSSSSSRSTRRSRGSQRRDSGDAAEAEAVAPGADTPDPEPEEAPKPARRSRARAAAPEPEEPKSEIDAGKARLEQLRGRSRAARKSTTE